VLTATLLGLPALAWFLLFFGAGWLVLGAFFGFLFGRLIKNGETPFKPGPPEQLPVEPESPADLDDWLAAEGPLEEFKVWKRPTASTSMRRAA
jgi:hypothetical protein